MKWAMGFGVVIGILVVFASAAGAGPNPNAKLAMHLIASTEYLYCEDFALASAAEINADLTMAELAASNYCGYVVFVASDLDTCVMGVEYFVTGWPMGRGGPTFAGPAYCGAEFPLVLGQPFEALGGIGGIVSLGYCYWNPVSSTHPFASISFDLTAYTGYLPISLNYAPSAFSDDFDPHNFVMGPDPDYSQDRTVEEFGCVIGTDASGVGVEILSPNGGETWYVGSGPPIEWSGGPVENVRIEYSTDGGGIWTDVVASVPNTGLFLWTIPNTPSANCLVRLSDADDGTPLDVSDTPFEIASSGPRVVHVPADWPSIQYGIYGAAPGDTVLVAPGVYDETIRMKGGVAVRSETGRGATTVDGGGAYHVVVFGDTSETARLEGFTITGGSAFGYSLTENMGGGILFDCSGGTVVDCIVTGNSAEWHGGGIGGFSVLTVTIQGCMIVNNTSQLGAGVGVLGGDEIRIICCDIVDNTAPTGCAVHFDNHVDGKIDRSIIAFTSEGWALCCNEFSTAAVSCSDIYGNALGDWTGCIEDQYEQFGNLSEDPLFCCPARGDYHLRSSSPCAAHPTCGLIGALGVECVEPSLVEPATWTKIKAKYR